MNFICSLDKAFYAKIHRVNGKSKSKNAQDIKIKFQEKFRICAPNNAKEALILDKTNRDFKWQDAIDKELSALEKWKFRNLSTSLTLNLRRHD